jgi:hypothetical protein
MPFWTPENNTTIEFWNTEQLQKSLKDFEKQNPDFVKERDKIIENYVKSKQEVLKKDISWKTRLKLDALMADINYIPTPWDLNEDWTPPSQKELQDAIDNNWSIIIEDPWFWTKYEMKNET